jgi:hypothetical protein
MAATMTVYADQSTFDENFLTYMKMEREREKAASYKKLYEQFGGTWNTPQPAPFHGGTTGVAMPQVGELTVGAPMEVAQTGFNPNTAPPVQVGGTGGYMGRDDRWKSIMNFPVYPWQRG